MKSQVRISAKAKSIVGDFFPFVQPLVDKVTEWEVQVFREVEVRTSWPIHHGYPKKKNSTDPYACMPLCVYFNN